MDLALSRQALLRQTLSRQAPSRRTPDSPSHLNTVDNIERYLEEDHHRTWGFIVYRCVYGDDAAWDTFISRFRQEIRDILQFYNGLDMMDSLDMTVISDPDSLDGASTSAVREHFRQWAVRAPQEEQGTGPGLSQRYRYCIQVDEEALQSVLDGPGPSPLHRPSDGYVNLIWKDWTPREPEAEEDEEEDDNDSIEGCTEHDVGWMMVGYQNVMLNFYYQLRGMGTDNWEQEYRRPPEVVYT